MTKSKKYNIKKGFILKKKGALPYKKQNIKSKKYNNKKGFILKKRGRHPYKKQNIKSVTARKNKDRQQYKKQMKFFDSRPYKGPFAGPLFNYTKYKYNNRSTHKKLFSSSERVLFFRVQKAV